MAEFNILGRSIILFRFFSRRTKPSFAYIWRLMIELMSINTYVWQFLFLLGEERSADFDHWRYAQSAGDVDVLWRHAFPSLSCTCTGVAQGLVGKERDGRRMPEDGVPTGTNSPSRQGEGVALTYLCRVLHATPISGAAETNPLCTCHAGWYLGMPTLCAFSWGLSAEPWGC